MDIDAKNISNTTISNIQLNTLNKSDNSSFKEIKLNNHIQSPKNNKLTGKLACETNSSYLPKKQSVKSNINNTSNNALSNEVCFLINYFNSIQKTELTSVTETTTETTNVTTAVPSKHKIDNNNIDNSNSPNQIKTTKDKSNLNKSIILSSPSITISSPSFYSPKITSILPSSSNSPNPISVISSPSITSPKTVSVSSSPSITSQKTIVISSTQTTPSPITKQTLLMDNNQKTLNTNDNKNTINHTIKKTLTSPRSIFKPKKDNNNFYSNNLNNDKKSFSSNSPNSHNTIKNKGIKNNNKSKYNLSFEKNSNMHNTKNTITENTLKQSTVESKSNKYDILQNHKPIIKIDNNILPKSIEDPNNKTINKLQSNSRKRKRSDLMDEYNSIKENTTFHSLDYSKAHPSTSIPSVNDTKSLPNSLPNPSLNLNLESNLSSPYTGSKYDTKDVLKVNNSMTPSPSHKDVIGTQEKKNSNLTSLSKLSLKNDDENKENRGKTLQLDSSLHLINESSLIQNEASFKGKKDDNETVYASDSSEISIKNSLTEGIILNASKEKTNQKIFTEKVSTIDHSKNAKLQNITSKNSLSSNSVKSLKDKPLPILFHQLNDYNKFNQKDDTIFNNKKNLNQNQKDNEMNYINKSVNEVKVVPSGLKDNITVGNIIKKETNILNKTNFNPTPKMLKEKKEVNQKFDNNHPLETIINQNTNQNDIINLDNYKEKVVPANHDSTAHVINLDNYRYPNHIIILDHYNPFDPITDSNDYYEYMNNDEREVKKIKINKEVLNVDHKNANKNENSIDSTDSSQVIYVQSPSNSLTQSLNESLNTIKSKNKNDKNDSNEKIKNKKNKKIKIEKESDNDEYKKELNIEDDDEYKEELNIEDDDEYKEELNIEDDDEYKEELNIEDDDDEYKEDEEIIEEGYDDDDNDDDDDDEIIEEDKDENEYRDMIDYEEDDNDEYKEYKKYNNEKKKGNKKESRKGRKDEQYSSKIIIKIPKNRKIKNKNINIENKSDSRKTPNKNENDNTDLSKNIKIEPDFQKWNSDVIDIDNSNTDIYPEEENLIIDIDGNHEIHHKNTPKKASLKKEIKSEIIDVDKMVGKKSSSRTPVKKEKEVVNVDKKTRRKSSIKPSIVKETESEIIEIDNLNQGTTSKDHKKITIKKEKESEIIDIDKKTRETRRKSLNKKLIKKEPQSEIIEIDRSDETSNSSSSTPNHKRKESLIKKKKEDVIPIEKENSVNLDSDVEINIIDEEIVSIQDKSENQQISTSSIKEKNNDIQEISNETNNTSFDSIIEIESSTDEKSPLSDTQKSLETPKKLKKLHNPSLKKIKIENSVEKKTIYETHSKIKKQSNTDIEILADSSKSSPNSTPKRSQRNLSKGESTSFSTKNVINIDIENELKSIKIENEETSETDIYSPNVLSSSSSNGKQKYLARELRNIKEEAIAYIKEEVKDKGTYRSRLRGSTIASRSKHLYVYPKNIYSFSSDTETSSNSGGNSSYNTRSSYLLRNSSKEEIKPKIKIEVLNEEIKSKIKTQEINEDLIPRRISAASFIIEQNSNTKQNQYQYQVQVQNLHQDPYQNQYHNQNQQQIKNEDFNIKNSISNSKAKISSPPTVSSKSNSLSITTQTKSRSRSRSRSRSVSETLHHSPLNTTTKNRSHSTLNTSINSTKNEMLNKATMTLYSSYSISNRQNKEMLVQLCRPKSQQELSIFVYPPLVKPTILDHVQEILTRSQIEHCLRKLLLSKKFPRRYHSPRYYPNGSRILFYTKNNPINYYHQYHPHRLNLLISKSVTISFIRPLIRRISWEQAWYLTNTRILVTFLRMQLQNQSYFTKSKYLSPNYTGKDTFEIVLKRSRDKGKHKEIDNFNYYDRNQRKRNEFRHPQDKYSTTKNLHKSEKIFKLSLRNNKIKEKEKDDNLSNKSIEDDSDSLSISDNIKDSFKTNEYPEISKMTFYSNAYNNKLMKLIGKRDFICLMKNLYFINHPKNITFKHDILNYLKKVELSPKSNYYHFRNKDPSQCPDFKEKNYFEWNCPVHHCHEMFSASIYIPNIYDLLEKQRIFPKSWYQDHPFYGKNRHGYYRVARLLKAFLQSYRCHQRHILNMQILDHLLEHRKSIRDTMEDIIDEEKDTGNNRNMPDSLLKIITYNVSKISKPNKRNAPFYAYDRKDPVNYAPLISVNTEVSSSMGNRINSFKSKLINQMEEQKCKNIQSHSLISKSFDDFK